MCKFTKQKNKTYGITAMSLPLFITSGKPVSIPAHSNYTHHIVINAELIHISGRTIKFANSPPCACRGSTGQKPQYGLMMTYQCFTAVVVDLWQSLSEWHLLLSACVLVCRRENVGARITRATNEH